MKKIEMKLMILYLLKRFPAVYKSHCSLHSSLTMYNHWFLFDTIKIFKEKSNVCVNWKQFLRQNVMTLSLTHSGIYIYTIGIESSLYRLRNEGVHLPFFFFSSNEILNLRLNICLSYLFVIVKTIYEKCKTKLRCYPSNNLFKHFSYKQFYSINMLFASFTLERYLKSTHTYRIGYHD